MESAVFKSVYAFECSRCGTSVGSSVKANIKCPNCNQNCRYISEGVMLFPQTLTLDKVDQQPVASNDEPEINQYPLVLTAKHVAEILDISLRVAYEIMESKDFPVIRIGRNKKVSRKAFFEWLEKQYSE